MVRRMTERRSSRPPSCTTHQTSMGCVSMVWLSGHAYAPLTRMVLGLVLGLEVTNPNSNPHPSPNASPHLDENRRHVEGVCRHQDLLHAVRWRESPNPNPNPNPNPHPNPNPNPNPNQVAAEDDVFDSAQVQPRIRRVAASGT